MIVIVLVFCFTVPFVTPRKRTRKYNRLKFPSPIKRDYDEDIMLDVNGVSFTMVAVEGGTFTIRNAGKNGSVVHNNGISARNVELSSFYIGQTPVTKELWKAVMCSGEFNGTQNGKDLGGDLLSPVEGVSNGDCHKFLQKLNAKTGKNFRFSTEEEWEYASCGDHKSSERLVRGNSEDLSAALHNDLGLRLALN